MLEGIQTLDLPAADAEMLTCTVAVVRCSITSYTLQSQSGCALITRALNLRYSKTPSVVACMWCYTMTTALLGRGTLMLSHRGKASIICKTCNWCWLYLYGCCSNVHEEVCLLLTLMLCCCQHLFPLENAHAQCESKLSNTW